MQAFGAGVNQLAGVFFEVRARDANFLALNSEVPLLANRFVVLRDLIAFRQVRIEIVFAIEFGSFRNLAVQRESRANRQLQGALIQDRQNTRHSEANRTDLIVWSLTEFSRARAKNLGLCFELGVYFQPNHSVVFHRRSLQFWDRRYTTGSIN